MSKDKSLLSSFTPKNGGFVSYRNENKGKIIGTYTIGKFPNPTIEKVLFVYGLNHNILSISQLCDKYNDVTFYYS